MKEGLIGAVIGAVLAAAAGGVDTWYNVRQETDRLRQESSRLEQELEVANADRAVAVEDLRIAREQFESDQAAVYGQAAQQMEAARRAFTAPDATDEDRSSAVRRLAGSIVEASTRGTDVVAIDEPLPPGVHQNATGLTELLGDELYKVDLNRVDLHGHYWSGAMLDRVLLRAADLRAVDFTDASLQSTYFDNALLQCADFSGAKMDMAQMGGADLSWADLRGVDLTGVVGLSTERLAGIAYDDGTQWPDSVNEADLDEPSEYSEPRLCLDAHLKEGAATAQSSPQPEAQPSPTS